MSSPVWVITGASNGFGRVLANTALAANHRVIAVVRNKTKSADAVDEITSRGGHVIELDMTASQATIASRIKEAEAIHGQIDYLVNNAGYSLLGAFEQFSEKEIQLQYQTNVFGPLYVAQAALPGMRARRSGTIVNVSSVAGQDSTPSCSAYASSKFALEGLTESLAREVVTFGISVLLVEPGAYRTNFLHALNLSENEMPAAYKGTPADDMLGKFKSLKGKQPGNPDKAVAHLFQVITGTGTAGRLKGKVLRLVLGMDAVNRIEAKTNKLKEDLEEARKLEGEESTAF